MFSRIKRILNTRKEASNFIILGVEYPEYKLCKALKLEGHKVHFFISDDPWKYNTLIDNTVCRNPIELGALCMNYEIDCVYYCDLMWLKKIPMLPAQTKVIRFPA